jgi:hypothetical protein
VDKLLFKIKKETAMNKKQLMPKVMVYNNVLNDTEYITSVIKQSEVEEEQGKYYINKWGNWGRIGKSTQLKNWLFNISNGSLINVGDESDECCDKRSWFLLEKEGEILSHNCNKDIGETRVPPEEIEWFKSNKHSLINEKNSIDQRAALNSIRKAYKKVLLDYIKDWGSDEYFDKVNNFNLKDGSWQIPNSGILHHSTTPDDYSMSMTYHTDTHQYDTERGGNHFILTITMYLNDDYEGGELTFLNENDKDVIHYRPKAGDITVFPSAVPYWHGVERVESGDRYLIRSFLSKEFEPSDLWKKNAEHYGLEEYKKMEYERISKEYNNPKYFKLAVYNDDIVNKNKDGSVSIGDYVGMIGFPFYVDKKRGYYKN